MATMPILQNPIAGKTPVLNNTGMPNPNNQVGPVATMPGGGGRMNPFDPMNPTNVNNPYLPVSPVSNIPVGTPGPANPGGTGLGNLTPYSSLLPTNPTTGININPLNQPNPTTGYVPSVTNPIPQTNNTYSGVSQQEDKQLVDIYGKGTGNLLASEIGNLGSNDSSYMQAYDNAMAGQNAENLATLDTTLGNQGVSADSSTAAIANADFESQITAQEGLQEQQLQMNDLQNLLGLTESTMDASKSEVAQSGWNVFGHVLEGIGNVATGGALGGILNMIPSSQDVMGAEAQGVAQGLGVGDLTNLEF